MTYMDCFDVLNISDNQKSVDIIQTLMGNKCLGTFFQNGLAKLYFNSGMREEVNIKCEELLTRHTLEWAWETLTKENWHLAWQEYFKPVIIANKLAVIPHWENDCPVELNIKIKPGMAFGTGHHESTWLMLKQMLKYLHPGMSVLDLGTGSGILSIAAHKIGACKVDAVENDIECATNFHENLELNNITRSIQFHHSDVLDWNQLNYDLILANINQKIIEKFLPNCILTNAQILLSGILEKNYNNIEEKLHSINFEMKEKIIKGEWICVYALRSTKQNPSL